MKKIYQEIFELARPFLAVRENIVHTEICYHYAQKLNAYYGGREEIVFPAILLHDVGWSAVPEEKLLQAFGPGDTDKELNRVHEVEGAKIAADILRQVSFLSEEDRREICAIVEKHDSGETASSLEEKLVKDADKLFRFNPRGFEIDYRRFKVEPQQYCAFLLGIKEKWLFTGYAKKMAAEELEKIKENL